MKFNDIVAVTGAPGLYQVIKADDRAIVVESLDARKKRQLIKGNMVVSKLMDVSIYTETDSQPVVSILKSIQEKFGKELPVDKKSSKDQLMGFLKEVLPDYDEEKVYPSNVKKLISWYGILSEYDLEFVVEEEEEEAKEESQESEKEEPKEKDDSKETTEKKEAKEAPKKKPAGKKSTSKKPAAKKD
ncbi:MAG: DUF5606 domain-containing protein [Bacteroidota bacterium]